MKMIKALDYRGAIRVKEQLLKSLPFTVLNIKMDIGISLQVVSRLVGHDS
jgi:hypothetical protein